MILGPQLLLVGAVATVGVLHTVVPDHWVPITLIARQRGWSSAQTARASLVANDGKTLIAQKSFGGERPTATADLSGAVGALGAGGDALVSDIVGWLAQVLDAASPQGLAAIKQCKGS